MQPTLILGGDSGCLWLVENAFSTEECAGLIRWAEEKGYAPTGAHYPPGYRNNDRLVVDDPAMARAFWDRLASTFPSTVTEDDGTVWEKESLNTRFRSCRYRDGQAFCRHQDGAYSPSEDQRSWFTFMIYLNGGAAFDGGATRFFDGPQGALTHAVVPRTGNLVVFDHRLWHDGEGVGRGVKYVLRSDVIYRRRAALPTGTGHLGYVFCVRFGERGTLWSGGRDATVRAWDGARATKVLRGHHGSVTTVLPDGEAVWRGCRDGTWRSQDVVVQGHEGAVLSSCSAGGSLFTAGADGTVARWSREGAEQGRFTAHKGWVWNVTAARDGLVTCGEDGSAAHWSLSGELRWRWQGTSPLRALDAVEGAVVVGDGDGVLHVLEDSGLTQRHALHQGAITSVRHVGRGSVCTGGEDGFIRRVDLHSGTVSVVGKHDGMVRALDVRDGVLASGSYDGTVRRWNLL
jgi:WD40 repeat protein